MRTLDEVIKIATSISGADNLTASSAVDQDMRICGQDIDEFAEDLAKQFNADTASWPWNRFVDLNEPHLFTGLWLFWRLFTWPIRGRISDPSPYERLELGHIAAVIDRGQWFEP
jgi:Protein of unknown function (DUF1493)